MCTTWAPDDLGWGNNAEKASHTFPYHNSYHPSKMVLKPKKVDLLPLQLPSARGGLARSFSAFIIFSFLHIHIRVHVPPHRTEDRGENLIFVTDTSQWERGTQKAHVSCEVHGRKSNAFKDTYQCVHTENRRHPRRRSWLCAREHRRSCSLRMLRRVLHQPSPIIKLPLKSN